MNKPVTGLKNFLVQFDGMDKLRAEAILYTLAVEQVEGYNGGMWSEVQIGNLWIPVVPESYGDKVHVVVASNYADETTDLPSAGAAFAIYVVSRIQNNYAFSRDNQVKAEKYCNLYHAYRDAIFADDNGLDHSAIFSIID